MAVTKADWAIVREAERDGLVVAMTSRVERQRTRLNEELSDYFRRNSPNYPGTYGEDEAEDVLFALNEYLDENNVDKPSVEFPLTSGTEIYLIPITDNLQLKVLVTDEYYGGGDYSKYVGMSFFVINEKTTTQDVDVLIKFIEEHLSII